MTASCRVGSCAVELITKETQVNLIGAGLSARDNRQTGGAPLRKAVFQSARLETTSTKRRNCFVGEDAVGASAVGDDLLCGIEFSEARCKLAQGDIHGVWQMS